MSDTDQGVESLNDPFFADDPVGTEEEQPSSPVDIQEPSIDGRAAASDLPPPPDDHADYGLVGEDQPPAYEPPPVFEGAPVYVPQSEAPQPVEATEEAPPPVFEGAPVYVPGGEQPVVPQAPAAAVPTAPPVAKPPVAKPPVELPPLVPPPMFDQPAGMPVVSPVGQPGSNVPTQASSTAAGVVPDQRPEEPMVATEGMQGPEFQTMRERGMDNAGSSVGGVMLPTTQDVVEEEVHPSVASEFASHSAGFGGRSPVNLSSRTTRLGLAAVVIALVAFLVIQLVPSKEASGTVIERKPAKGDTFAYHFSFDMKGTVEVLGKSQTAVIDLDADATMKVVKVDGSGNATVATTLDNIRLAVSPKPVIPVPVPQSVKSTYTVAPDGSLVSGELGLSSIGTTGQAQVPGWDGQAFPVFPVRGLVPGDTWKEEITVPFVGQDLTTSSEYRMLDIKEDPRGRLAVVSATSSTPFDITATVDELLADSGQDAADLGIPEGVEPTFSYDGTMTTIGTYWMNVVTGQLDSLYLTGKIDMNMTIELGPETLTAPLTGEFTLSVRAQQPPATRASLEVGGSESPEPSETDAPASP